VFNLLILQFSTNSNSNLFIYACLYKIKRHNTILNLQCKTTPNTIFISNSERKEMSHNMMLNLFILQFSTNLNPNPFLMTCLYSLPLTLCCLSKYSNIKQIFIFSAERDSFRNLRPATIYYINLYYNPIIYNLLQ